MSLYLISVFMFLDMGKGRVCVRGLSYRDDMGDRERREGTVGGREKRKGKTRKDKGRGVWKGREPGHGMGYCTCVCECRCAYIYVYSIKAYI